MEHNVSHSLSTDVARERINLAYEYYKQQFAQFQPTLRWVSDTEAQVTLTNGGTRVDGTVVLEEGNIVVDLKLPFALRLFQGRIKQTIDTEAPKWLGPQPPQL